MAEAKKPTRAERVELLDQAQKLLDLYGDEPLHPDLRPHVSRRSFGETLHHPLVIQVPYFPQTNKHTNGFYLQKKAALAEALADKKWPTYLFLHERPYRIDALDHILFTEEVTDPDVIWPLIGNVWTDSENIWQCLDQWVDIWNTEGRAHSILMDEEECAALAAMPDVITVYRGVSHRSSIESMSWTIDEKKAAWFAKRFARGEENQPMVATGIINKRDVLAYFTSRGESEIVAFPEDVHVENVSWV